MSKEPAVTPWFRASVTPVRCGYYEVKYPEHEETTFRYWNGSDWTITKGAKGGTLFGCYANDRWRGLAKEPK